MILNYLRMHPAVPKLFGMNDRLIPRAVMKSDECRKKTAAHDEEQNNVPEPEEMHEKSSNRDGRDAANRLEKRIMARMRSAR